jgi:photosystem II stability/assembly factor-like uncharacterized protein
MRVNGIRLNLSRRTLLTSTCGAGAFLYPALASAKTLTGIMVLDTPARVVRQPDQVFLEAIARAGNRLVAVGEHGVIIYSDDYGGHWTQASVPVDITLTCIGFATPLIGWAAGNFGVILSTLDGGTTWQMQLDGIQANLLTLAAAQNAAAQESASPGVALAARRAGIFVQDGPTQPFLSLLVLSPYIVIVFGAYRMTMMTRDGGKNWVDWSLHVFDRLSHNLYGVQAIGTTIYLVGEAGLVFCSNDGGNEFLPVTSPVNATLFGILGAKDGSLIVFGVAGNSFRSNDGGKTWTPVDLLTQENLMAGYVLPSGVVLIASEAGQLFRSEDNGVTFAAVSGVSQIATYGIEQAANDDLVLIGSSGVTILSHDRFKFLSGT